MGNSDILTISNYLANSCNGCKGFFRRSLFAKKSYVCRFKNDCEIRKESRNACRQCRLRRCLAIGMNPDAVQLERSNNHSSSSENGYNYSLKRMLQTAHIPKVFAEASSQTEICSKHFQQSTPSSSSQEDTEQIKLLVSIEHTAWNLRDKLEDIIIEIKPLGKLNLKFEAAFFNPEFVSRRYPLQFNGSRRLDQKLFTSAFRRNFTFCVDFISRLPDFKRLNYDDQLSIAKRRIVNLSWTITAFHSYLNNVDGICFPNGAFQYYKRDPNPTESQELIDNFFEKLMPIFMGDLVSMLHQLNFDFIEYVILKSLIFFRDEFFLSESGLKIVRSAWKRYANLLYKYILKKTSGNISEAVTRYSDILQLIPPILYLTAKLNERVEMSSFFGIFDMDGLAMDCHSSALFNTY